MKGFLSLLVLLGLSAGLFALGALRRQTTGQSFLHVADEVALTVTVTKPHREQIIRLVQAPGDVEAEKEVEVSSEIVAKIEEMPVEEGDLVHQGDLLCRLDDKNLRAEVESAQARLQELRASIEQADADLEKAQRDVSRQKSLSETDATSQLEVADYLTTLKKTRALKQMRQAQLIQAQAVLKRMQEDLKRTVITAPIDGIISRLKAKQGEVVVTGTMNNPGTVIMTISDLSHMQVRTRVDEVDVPLVKAEQKARVYLQSAPDEPVPARVIRVASKGSRPSGRDVVTFETLLEVLSTNDRIRPGMTANVEIEVAKRDDAITVPVEAIVHRMRRDLPKKLVKEIDSRQADVEMSARARQAQYIKVAYVMDKEVARVRLVDVGIADTQRAEIRNGLTLNDTVITGPYRSLDQLEDGKKVALLKPPKKPGEQEAKPEKESEESQVTDDDQSHQKGKERDEHVARKASP